MASGTPRADSVRQVIGTASSWLSERQQGIEDRFVAIERDHRLSPAGRREMALREVEAIGQQALQMGQVVAQKHAAALSAAQARVRTEAKASAPDPVVVHALRAEVAALIDGGVGTRVVSAAGANPDAVTAADVSWLQRVAALRETFETRGDEDRMRALALEVLPKVQDVQRFKREDRDAARAIRETLSDPRIMSSEELLAAEADLQEIQGLQSDAASVLGSLHATARRFGGTPRETAADWHELGVEVSAMDGGYTTPGAAAAISARFPDPGPPLTAAQDMAAILGGSS